MPLRHLTLKEPQYVPRYNQIDPNLLAQTHQSIEKQVGEFQQRRGDTIDAYDTAMNQTFASLSEQERGYGSQVIDTVRGEIDQYVEQHGSRGSMNFLERTTRSATEQLNPLYQKANYMNSIQESLADSKADADIKKFVVNESTIGNVEFDESGRALDFQGGVSGRDLDTAKNWVDYTEFLTKFNSKSRNADSNQQATFNIDPRTEQYYRQKVRQITADSVLEDNILALIANPQIRNQLDLQGRMLLSQASEDSNITVDNEGKVQTKFAVLRTKDGRYVDNEGNFVSSAEEAGTEIKAQTFQNIAHWQATIQATPFAMRDSFRDLSFDARLGEGSGNSKVTSGSFQLADMIDYRIDPVKAGTFFEDLLREEHQLSSSIMNYSSNVIPELLGRALSPGGGPLKNLDLNFGEDGLAISLEGDSFNINNPEDLENLAGKINSTPVFNELKNYLTSLQDSHTKLTYLEDLKRDSENYTRNKVLDTAEDPAMVEYLNIDRNGTISIDQSLVDQAVMQGDLQAASITRSSFEPQVLDAIAKEFDLITEFSGRMDGGEVRDNILAQLPENQLINIPDYVQSPLRGKTLIKKGRGFYDLGKAAPDETRQLKKLMRVAKDAQQESVDKIRNVGIHEFKGLLLNRQNDLHKAVIDAIEMRQFGIKEGSGALVDGAGNEIMVDSKKGERFVPYGLGSLEGESIVTGRIVDESDNTVQGNIRLSGTFSSSVLQNELGEDFVNIIGISTLRNIVPSLVEGKKEFTLHPAQMASILGTFEGGKNPINHPINVEYRKTYTGGLPGKYFYVTKEDQTSPFIIASTYEDLYYKLLIYSNEN